MDPEAHTDPADSDAQLHEGAGDTEMLSEGVEVDKTTSELQDDEDDEVLQLPTEGGAEDEAAPAAGKRRIQVVEARTSKRRSAAASRYGAEDGADSVEPQSAGRGSLGTIPATKAPGAPIEPDGKLRVCLACKENHRTIYQCRTKAGHDAPNWNEEQEHPQEYHHAQLRARQLQEARTKAQLQTQVRYPSSGRRGNPDRFTPSLAPDRPKEGAAERPRIEGAKRPVGRPPLNRPPVDVKPRKVATGPIQAEERAQVDTGRLDRVCARCKPNHRTIQQCRVDMGHTEPNWCAGGTVAPNRYTGRVSGSGPRRPASGRKKKRSQFYNGDSDSWGSDEFEDEEEEAAGHKRPYSNGHRSEAVKPYRGPASRHDYDAYWEEGEESEEIVIEGESFFEEDDKAAGSEPDEEPLPEAAWLDDGSCHTWSHLATRKLLAEDLIADELPFGQGDAEEAARQSLAALFREGIQELEVALTGFHSQHSMPCKLSRANEGETGYRLGQGWRDCLHRLDFGHEVRSASIDPVKEGCIVELLQRKPPAPDKPESLQVDAGVVAQREELPEPREAAAGMAPPDGDPVVAEAPSMPSSTSPPAPIAPESASVPTVAAPVPSLASAGPAADAPAAAAADSAAAAAALMPSVLVLMVRVRPVPMPCASVENKILVKKVSQRGASQRHLRLPEATSQFFNDMTPEEENQAQDAALIAAENRRKEEREAIKAAEAAAAAGEPPPPPPPTLATDPEAPAPPFDLFGGGATESSRKTLRCIDDFGQIWDFTLWRRAKGGAQASGADAAGGVRSTRRKTKESYDYFLTGGWEEYKAQRGVKEKDTLVLYRGDQYRIGLHLQPFDDETGREPLVLEAPVSPEPEPEPHPESR